MERSIISLLLIVICTVVMLYDVYAIYSNEQTISYVLQNWSSKFPILPFLFGILCGHLFWPQTPGMLNGR